MWIEKEHTKNPNGKNKTHSEKWIVLDAGHQIGINRTTVQQLQKTV